MSGSGAPGALDRGFAAVLARKRVVLASAAFLVLAGAAAYATMPRQEDPRMPDRFGMLVVPFPGADAETVERLVALPLQESLAQVDAVDLVDSTARADVAVTRIQLADRITDVETAWDEVEDAIAEARRDFPDGVGAPDLDKHLITNQEAIVLAVTGSTDPLALLRGARSLERALLGVDGVAEVAVIADPGEQVTVEYDAAAARRLGIPPSTLAEQLRARNRIIPAGSIRVGSRAASLSPGSALASLEDLAASEITLPSGAAVPLREVARVRYGPREPASSSMRHQGERGVALGVIAADDIDVVALGARVRATVDRLRTELAPLEIHELSFQPDYVEDRLDGLADSLLLGIVIVAGVLVVFMGLRLGLLVSAIVPLVTASSLALYAFGGGVLHQLSVAAFILALGLLVDNAIVVVESIQHYLDAGMARADAAIRSVRELAFPLATATGTTVAAFVPMLASEGPTGDFTRAIPIVAIVTLIVSYVFAVLVTPILASMTLRAKPRARTPRLRGLLGWLSRAGARHPIASLGVAAILVGGSLVSASGLPVSFFPRADRDQIIVEVVLPEGSHIDETDAASRVLERHLLDLPAVEQVSVFVGRSAPRFYYNLPIRPESPHFAHLLVETDGRDELAGVIDEIRRYSRAELPGVEVIPRWLEQGPPLRAPIEVRLAGDDPGALHAAAERVVRALRDGGQTLNVRHDLGAGRATLTVDVDDAAAARAGVTRADVAHGLLRETRGLSAGDLRSGEDPVPIVVRSSAGEDTDPGALPALETASRRGGLVPVAQVAEVGLTWRPAAIHLRDGVRVVTVQAQLADGVEYGDVVASLEPRLDALAGPEITWEWGGAVEGAGDANAAIAAAAPLGAILLLFFLLVEFNSFRRLGIILITVPLAAAGVIPGLLLAGEPFGFMSLLGVFALIGVVVNNAIVLLSVVDARRAGGASVTDALAEAVRLRTRPILLTTATTVAGLIPLATSSSALWPPMASAMIAGLLASTVLTLIVVPALYALLFPERAPSPDLGRLGEPS